MSIEQKVIYEKAKIPLIWEYLDEIAKEDNKELKISTHLKGVSIQTELNRVPLDFEVTLNEFIMYCKDSDYENLSVCIDNCIIHKIYEEYWKK